MLSILCTGLAILGVGVPPVSLAGDYGEPHVIVAAPEDPRFAHLSWPKVVRAKDGTLVVAYVAGRFHGTHGEGCPAVSLSTDGGKTFTTPKILKEYGPKDTYTSAGNVALGLADDGAIVLLSMAYKGDTANTIDGWRSPDSGKTWQAADVSRLANNKTGSVYGHVLPLPGKRLAVVGHYRSGSIRTAGLWISYSEDSGWTWSDPQTITADALVEPAFIFTAGRFVGLARPKQTPAWYSQVTSDNLGKTWLVQTKVLVAGKAEGVKYPSPGLFLDPNDSTRLIALVSQRFTAEVGNQLYGQIDLYSANVKTLEWKQLGRAARFPRSLLDLSDLTYGWMAPIDANRWFLVFYCGKGNGASAIYGLEFEPFRE